MGLEGCSTCSQLGNWFGGFFPAVGSMVTSTVASFTGGLAGVGWCWLGTFRHGFFGWDYGGFLSKTYTTEYILIREGDIALHLLPELHYTPRQKAWFISSRWVGLLHPELKSLGVCNCLLLLEFLDIPAGEVRVRWQQGNSFGTNSTAKVV